MFFASIVLIPILAGLLCGILSVGRRPAHALAAICVALGVAGAIATGVDANTTDRASSVAFGVVAGVVAALLVYAGQLAARATVRAMRGRRISD